MEKKVWENYEEAGITLLSLILTVVIMLILAAVTINVTLGDGGLVQQAQHAAEQTANATKSEREQLDNVASQINDIIAGIGSGGSGGDVTNSTGGEDTNQVGETNTVDTNSINTNSVEEANIIDTNTIEPEPEPEPLPDGTITIGDPQWKEDGIADIPVTSSESGYIIQYQINGTKEGSWLTVQNGTVPGVKHGDTVYARLTDGEQYSEIQNKKIEDLIPPTVKVTAQGSPTTNSITVTAGASDNESGMVASPTYTFQIRQSGSGSYTTPSGAENISGAQYTFTGLTQGTTYDIQVIVNGDNAGNSGIGTLLNQTTATVPGADEGLINGSITASPALWKDYKATTTLTTTTDFKIQYQVNGTAEESWSAAANSPVSVSNLDHGSTVYARLTDGVNAGDYAAINILDGIAPTVTVAVDEVTDTTIKVTVTAEDNESGLASSNAYRYYLNDEDTPIATIDNNTYIYTGLTGSTDYTIKVEAVDKGNNPGTGTASARTNMTPTPIGDILEAGDYVYYEDGQGTRQLCAVLYDSSSPYGVEIITMNTVEDITLGNGMPVGLVSQSISYFNMAMNSYNNAISTLNNATTKYINASYIDRARCVGSLPNNPNSEAGMYSRTENWFSSYNGKFKDTDMNYELDTDQMIHIGILEIDEPYWMASRFISEIETSSSFHLYEVSLNYGLDIAQFCQIHEGGTVYSRSFSEGLRPVFHLKSNIKVTGGTGEEDSPYTLGT